MENTWKNIGVIMFKMKVKSIFFNFSVFFILWVMFFSLAMADNANNMAIVMSAFESHPTNLPNKVHRTPLLIAPTNTSSSALVNSSKQNSSVNSIPNSMNASQHTINANANPNSNTNVNTNANANVTDNTSPDFTSNSKISNSGVIALPPSPNSLLRRPSTLPLPVSNTQNLPLVVKGLDSIDNDALSINEMKRKLELQKLKSEFDKNNSKSILGTQNNNINSTILSNINKKPSTDTLQTVVTDVMINRATGQKFATLLFADGSSLDAEQGTHIDDYVLNDISMSGATLVKYNNNGKIIKKVHLKRVYGHEDSSGYTRETNKGQATIFATPTQTLTNGNFNNPFTSSMNAGSSVPPIQ
jgi:hypothetical protein